MTQESYCWSCTAVGDGGPQSYSVEIVELINRIYGNSNPTTDGVVYWTDTTVFPGFTNAFTGGTLATSFLSPSYLGANVMRITRGVGLVQGWVYVTDTVVDTNVSGGNANATDIIGLRRDLAGQTVRVFHGRGAASSTYSLVQTAATWEIPLVEVTLDGSGNYSSHTDVRRFVGTPIHPAAKSSIFVPVISGYNFNGVIVPEYQKIISGSFTYSGEAARLGFNLSAGGTGTYQVAAGVFQVPYDAVGGEIDFAPFMSESGAIGTFTGNSMRLWYSYFNAGATPVGANGAQFTYTFTSEPPTYIDSWNDAYGSNLTASPGDVINLVIVREFTHVDDTAPSVQMTGWEVRLHRHITTEMWPGILPRTT